MREFTYSRPLAEDEVLAELRGPDVVAVAGGTELLNWMRLGILAPRRLLDIGRLPSRRSIRMVDGDLLIGCLSTLNEIGEDPLVRAHATVLAEASLTAASAQIRNRATLGGNVLQRTRCAYFRAEEPLVFGCNKRAPGTGCGARQGLSDEHAIFGATAACAATHPSDPLVALACLDAQVEIASATGQRRIPVAELHLTQQEAREAGLDPARSETTLRGDELITAFRILRRPGSRSTYLKVRERQSYAYALVSAAARVHAVDGTVESIAIALGSVAQRPWRLRRAEAALTGRRLDDAGVRAAVQLDLRDARPLRGNAYKVGLAGSAAVRAVMAVAA